MACFFHGDEQSAAPPIRDSHSLGCISLRPPSVLGPLHPLQPVPFLLAHRDSFHPPAHRLSRGTFYFAQLGTYHFAATEAVRLLMRSPATSDRMFNTLLRYADRDEPRGTGLAGVVEA